MNYGYFDEVNREYVITKPNTPAPWANYLGSPAYGAIISNNAGGYSFEKSGANGRILRYRFNADDKPGRYIYIRDDETKDLYGDATITFVIDEFYCSYNNGVEEFQRIFDIQPE